MDADLTQGNVLKAARPLHARVWLFVSSAKLTGDLKIQLLNKINDFLIKWASHGTQLDAWSEIYFNHVVLIALDESQATASGCSQDALIRYVQALEKEFDITLLDRMLIPVFKHDTLDVIPLSEVTSAIESGGLQADDITLDLTVTNFAPIQSGSWKVSIANSWLNRYLN